MEAQLRRQQSAAATMRSNEHRNPTSATARHRLVSLISSLVGCGIIPQRSRLLHHISSNAVQPAGSAWHGKSHGLGLEAHRRRVSLHHQSSHIARCCPTPTRSLSPPRPPSPSGVGCATPADSPLRGRHSEVGLSDSQRTDTGSANGGQRTHHADTRSALRRTVCVRLLLVACVCGGELQVTGPPPFGRNAAAVANSEARSRVPTRARRRRRRAQHERTMVGMLARRQAERRREIPRIGRPATGREATTQKKAGRKEEKYA
jgi:hypothetical protein